MDTAALAALGAQLVDLLKQNAIEAGQELQGDLTDIADYAAARMQYLAPLINDAGFREALLAERDNVALKAAGRAIDRADAWDARLLSLAEGALSIGTKAISLVAAA